VTLDSRWNPLRGRWPIRVKNGAGATIPPFSLVLTSSATATDNEIVVTVVKPNAAAADFNFCGYLVTGPFAIGSGSSNEGLASNLSEPNYLSLDFAGATGNICGPKHGQFTASRHYYGYRVEGGATTVNGVNVAICKNIGVSTVMGQASASIGLTAVGTVNVFVGLTAGADSGMKITNAYTPLASVTSGGRVMVAWNGEQPHIIVPGAGGGASITTTTATFINSIQVSGTQIQVNQFTAVVLSVGTPAWSNAITMTTC
jgi:hypothetical protein